ncbi:bifunctional DNA primase/polymerase [Kutzneria buriramensis]|uniref:Bifunctional DNA primase/polymerase-like protein n=1 Tax=Kutzneria buriramensis TaxID=1045776 RepID=A0A3E0GV92_9PSEU|nr:bifunctional DNA primase/polymerase [Kutzneria buriramensis]REH29596.1 bifunctional DNA primase/polymerase-like protein [Kutzneria buriramensis]
MSAASARLSGSAVRRGLRLAAVEFAGHGWPVVPVSYFDGHSYRCVQADCYQETLHPVWRLWHDRASADPKMVAAWFRLLTLSVGVRTGVVFDVVSLPETTGTKVQAALAERQTLTPVAVWRERGHRLFWVERDLPWRPVLGRLDARVSARDGWVPVPPTPTRHGPVQWAVAPARTDWGFVRHQDFLAAAATLL